MTKTLYLCVIVALGSLLFHSCKKNDANYSMTANVIPNIIPKPTKAEKFQSTKLSATDTTYGATRTIIVIGSNFGNTGLFQVNQIILGIYNFTGLGDYTIQWGINIVSTGFSINEITGISGIVSPVNMQATNGSITISSISATSIRGTFNVSYDTSISISGSFNAPIIH
jgi:hypothetical protein